jgi:hypothetical protein
MDEEERRKKERRGEKEKRMKKIEANWTFYHLNPIVEAVLPNVFQNGSNSIQRAAPPEEPEPDPFF